MHGTKTLTLIAAAVLMTATAACGTSSDQGTSAAGQAPASASAPALEAARQARDTYLKQPTGIVQSERLKSAPPKKKVAFVQCADPSCAILAGYFGEAVKALGWDLVTVSATATDPGAAVQQAIDAGVDYISTTGFPMDLFKVQMAEAASRGIPLFLCYSIDVPKGPENNLYSDCYDATAAQAYADAMADHLAVDSGGTANILAVTIPSYPILNAQTEAMRARLAQNCPGCTLSLLEVSVNELAGGAVPQRVSSHLQTDPDVDYLFFTYNGLENGVHPALRSAGLLERVKLVGTQGGQAQMAGIVNGTSQAWTALSQELAMWTMADQMARLSVGQWSIEDERKAAIPPFYLVTTPEAARELVDEKDGWPGPAGFKDTFKKLWGV
jgi:ribose transport system substrate-binding protein